MNGAKTEPDFSGGSQSALPEQSVSSVELASVLQLSDSEVAKLARSAVLVRERDPGDSRAYLYPLLENTKRYILHLRGRKEKAGLLFLQEKSRTQRVLRQRAELEMAVKKGKLVSIEEAVAEFTPSFVALRHGFEKLLSIGVSQEVVDELLAILQREPCTNGDKSASGMTSEIREIATHDREIAGLGQICSKSEPSLVGQRKEKMLI
jgi:hypothetical protein